MNIKIFSSLAVLTSFFALSTSIAAPTGNDAIEKHRAGDYAAAEQLATQACEAGDPVGCFYLGFKLQGQKQFEKANPYYEKACNGNLVEGCMALGNNYRQGLGVKADISQTYRFYKRACEMGDKLACSHVQDMEENRKAK